MAGNAAEKVFDALGNPMRRNILRILSAGSLAVGEIASRLPVSRPAISKHLVLLEKAHLVAHEKQGNRNIFRLDVDGVRPAREFLEGFWEGALARFKLAAENSLRQKQTPPRRK